MKSHELISIENFVRNRSFVKLDMCIPKNLFYYAEGLENGCEWRLEGQQISIICIGHDDQERDNIIINIILKEEAIGVTEQIGLLEQGYLETKEVNLEFPYQTARKLLLEIIKEWSPYSLNLITK